MARDTLTAPASDAGAQADTGARRRLRIPRAAVGLLLPVLALIAAEAGVRAGLIPANLLPAPSQVLQTLSELAEHGLAAHVSSSALRVAIGFAGGAAQQLDFGGTYADADIDSVRLADMGTTADAWIAPLGNTTGNRPMFQLVGVGPNATLVAHDMLLLDGVDTVSVTSGASVPEDLVEGVLAFLAARGYPDAKAVHSAEESLIFALPPELRRDLRAAQKA